MVPFIGIASGIAAGNPGCGKAPLFLQQNPHLLEQIPHEWVELFLAPVASQNLYQSLGALYHQIAEKIFQTYNQHGYLLSMGGDHSCAIATWSGIAEAVRPNGDLGLLWIDAHMDSHTPETSESGNIHGMPLATLLGYGNSHLTEILTKKPKLLPQNLALVGIRSYESGEAELLRRLGVRVYFMEEVRERGLKEVIEEAVERVSQNTIGYGVSFDLDALDPSHCPAVGTPVEGGLDPEELLASFSNFYKRPPIAFEVVEYNPLLDNDLKTAQLLIRFLDKIVSDALHKLSFVV